MTSIILGYIARDSVQLRSTDRACRRVQYESIDEDSEKKRLTSWCNLSSDSQAIIFDHFLR